MYWISEPLCTICDSMDDCMNSCPADAIVKGTPYPYITDDCTDCGLCVDECPEGAIIEGED